MRGPRDAMGVARLQRALLFLAGCCGAVSGASYRRSLVVVERNDTTKPPSLLADSSEDVWIMNGSAPTTFMPYIPTCVPSPLASQIKMRLCLVTTRARRLP
jgi:hypothetical protein